MSQWVVFEAYTLAKKYLKIPRLAKNQSNKWLVFISNLTLTLMLYHNGLSR